MSIEKKKEYITRKQRWMAYNVFGYRQDSTANSFFKSYDKIKARVYLDYGVKIRQGHSKMFEDATDKEIDMMYNSTKKLVDMYLEQLNN